MITVSLKSYLMCSRFRFDTKHNYVNIDNLFVDFYQMLNSSISDKLKLN